MKKIIFSVILLILIVLVFRNKIEFFKTYPDSAMEIHDKWIDNTINYVSNERHEITKCLEMVSDLLSKENLTKFIKNIHDNDLNEVVMCNNLVINIIESLLRNVNPNNKRLLDILKNYLTCNVNYYQRVHNIVTSTEEPVPTTISTPSPSTSNTNPPPLFTSIATSTSSVSTTSVGIETFTSNSSQDICNTLIDEITEERKYDDASGTLINIRKPLFIELLANYLLVQDIHSVIDVLYNIYEEKYIKYLPQYNNNIEKLPCLIYDKSSCPKDICQLSTIDGNDKICHPKYTGDKPLDISAKVDSCSVITPYGKKYCEATKDKYGNMCVFDNVRNKCMTQNQKIKPIECGEINANTTVSFEQKCNTLQNQDGTQKCFYKRITNGGKTHNFCYDRNNDNNSSNLCYSFSGLDKQQIPEQLNCNVIDIKNGNDYYSIPPNKNAYDHDNDDICHLFDNSDTMKDSIPKNLDQKLNIDSIELQRKLCEGLVDRNGNKRCKFIEHNTFVSNNNNDQKLKSKFTKCISSDQTVDGNYIKGNATNVSLKKAECIKEPENVWSEENMMCVNKNSKCSDLKYENLCNYKKNCHWTSIGRHNVNANDHFERGYCNDIKTQHLEKIIDIVHRKEIDKLVKINELKQHINKIDSQVKSQDFLDKMHNNQ